jgi:hypothetical protein
MLDGAAKVKPMLAEAERLQMPAIGMTDHGNMFGASEFYNAATDVGIKPIIGIEAYIAPASRFETKRILWGDPSQKSDDVSGSGSYTHLTMVAENATGLRNLFKLSSLASFEGQLGKWSRMDAELIAEHASGIIATTGCPSGEVQTRLRLGHEREALESAAEWREIFGPDNYFLELMDHGLDIERRVRDGLLDIGQKLGIPPLATNDCHYVTRDHAHNHEALLCVQTGKTLSDPNRFKFDGDGYYLKSAEEMRRIWDADIPGACDSTLLIADRVQSYSDVWELRDRMPIFPVPEGHDQASWLRHEVDAGLARRFPSGVPQDYVDRAAYEIDVICAKGYPSYFLIVADLVGYARSVDIRVGPGRGSAAGSLVAYALRITDIDPIEHGLLFERFLNPERASMPDIDIDFDDRRRGEMVRYAAATPMPRVHHLRTSIEPHAPPHPRRPRRLRQQDRPRRHRPRPARPLLRDQPRALHVVHGASLRGAGEPLLEGAPRRRLHPARAAAGGEARAAGVRPRDHQRGRARHGDGRGARPGGVRRRRQATARQGPEVPPEGPRRPRRRRLARRLRPEGRRRRAAGGAHRRDAGVGAAESVGAQCQLLAGGDRGAVLPAASRGRADEVEGGRGRGRGSQG